MVATALLLINVAYFQNLEEVYERVAPAVVVVNCKPSVGSGFAIGDGRTIVTNAHVVSGKAENILVTAKNPQKGELIAFDSTIDVAIIRVKYPIPSALKFADQEPKVGSKIAVIGSPLGILDRSLSEGIVSGLRSGGDRNLIQFTAPVSKGSSGSPLINLRGEVIGVVSFGLAVGQSLNFAISASHIQELDSNPRFVNEKPVSEDTPPIEGRWFVVLSSYSASKLAAANSVARSANKQGLAAYVILSNKLSNFSKGLAVVVLGPFSKSFAQDKLKTAKKFSPTAYIKSGW